MSTTLNATSVFREEVMLKYQLFNSLFTSLPFQKIEKTGILLSLLTTFCEDGYNQGKNPKEIIESFFKNQPDYVTEKEKLDLLFRFIQYGERQVVLFDALEDAAFAKTHDLEGTGTLVQIETETKMKGLNKELALRLKSFAVRLVLTAHPTQFYPDSVLGIIHDLTNAIKRNAISEINLLLQQLGKTPFFKHIKPTPIDEANSLIWYLKNVFYHTIGTINERVISLVPEAATEQEPLIHMGFWPGGDRDGNPFVTNNITLEVARNLRVSLIECYLDDIALLKHRLTFKNIDTLLTKIERNIKSLQSDSTSVYSKDTLLVDLLQVRSILINEHNSLFLELLNSFIAKVQSFGFYFASLDIRQDSVVHQSVIDALLPFTNAPIQNYSSLDPQSKTDFLFSRIKFIQDPFLEPGTLPYDTFHTIRIIKDIQEKNGELACHRYIISQCESIQNILEIYFLVRNIWNQDTINIDIVPLFEKVKDLQGAGNIMRALYSNKIFRSHLKHRADHQTIMLGFSDGTKDGGYLMANWSIYESKESLTEVSRAFGLNVVFFDGRGGPPSRGGGKTHKFYASLGHKISNTEIQLTIQGQTISSSFGTIDAARFNMEQLLNAGIYSDVLADHTNTLNDDHRSLITQMADIGFEAFKQLKSHHKFISYLQVISPLNFYNETNIASRPSKRKQTTTLALDDLRAIPFVGSWSQIKQNVPGYFGVGTALQHMHTNGQWKKVQELYLSSLFFKTLIENIEMAMKKCYFPLTAYLQYDPEYAGLYKVIFDEYLLTEKYLLELTGHKSLMEDYPTDSLSIDLREKMVQPLLTIQQFSLMQLRKPEYKEHDLRSMYERLIIRSSFGIINAARNSV